MGTKMSENHYLRINVNEFMSMKPEEQNSLLCMQDDIVWGGKCLGAEKEYRFLQTLQPLYKDILK